MIDLNKNAIGLDGIEMQGMNLGKVVAQTLVNSSSGDPLKFWHWATKLYGGEGLDLDDSDKDLLKKFIKDSDVLTVLAKAQILKLI